MKYFLNKRVIARTISLTFAIVLSGCGGGDDSAPLSATPSATLFSKSGTGDTVFDIPKSVSKIKIKASYDGNSANFMVKIGGDSIVNELLGTSWKVSQFEGTYLLKDGRTTEIVNSSGVSWTFTDVK